MAASADSAGLSHFLKAPSKDVVAAVFGALFRLRHHTEEERVAAVQGLLALTAEEAPALASAAGNLLRRALYESSELPTVEAVRALLPSTLESRLQSLVASVRAARGLRQRPRLPPPPTPHPPSPSAPRAHCRGCALSHRFSFLACTPGARLPWSSAWACRAWRACPGRCSP